MAGPYDLIVFGTGPGGYVAAIRASQLGMKVAVVEKRATHGGTCLNVGCIPSKALLHASEAFDHANHGFAAMGINVSPKLDLAKMQAFKAEGVKGNVDGVAYLLKKNKIDSYHGTARIEGQGKVASLRLSVRRLPHSLMYGTGFSGVLVVHALPGGGRGWRLLPAAVPSAAGWRWRS